MRNGKDGLLPDVGNINERCTIHVACAWRVHVLLTFGIAKPLYSASNVFMLGCAVRDFGLDKM